VNWPGPSGGGDSKAEALEDLGKNFDEFKVKNKLPRPGTKVPVQFASTTRINGHAALAKDFIQGVLELDWAFISDEFEPGGLPRERDRRRPNRKNPSNLWR
jgi:hypothetical protein